MFVMEFLRRKALMWTTSTALSMLGLRFLTPTFVDFVFDILTVVLVFVAGKLAADAPTNKA
jgi:hypothetical protein